MNCPEYYRMANDRELCQLLSNEVNGFLETRVSHYVSHCIMSAMEHRYRCGKKAGETETDRAAERWWLDAARLSWEGPSWQIERIINICIKVIEYEREVYIAERAAYEREVYIAERAAGEAFRSKEKS